MSRIAAPVSASRQSFNHRSARAKLRRAVWQMEGLEQRTLLAFNMTLSFNPTVGVTPTTVASTTTFEATASAANLHFQDIHNALAAGNSVVVTSGATGTEPGNITDLAGVAMPGIPAGASLTLQTGTGANLVGDITLRSVSIDGTSPSMAINAARNVTVGQLSAGTFLAPTALASATITAATGSVTEGGPFQGPIYATNLAITASTGIGTSGTPLPTAVSNLEAQTTTGGIFINNTGNLSIGGVTASLDGVQATTSGDVKLTNAGSIVLAGTSVEDIRASSGNVEVRANGAAANIETHNDSADAIDSNNGNVTLVAGQDILLGSPATDNFGDVEAGGNLNLSAGRDIVIDENTFVDAFGTGTISASATRNFSILASDGTTGARVSTLGGDITITTGPGGVLTANSGAFVAAIDTDDSSDGNITINSDDMSIISPITAGTGIVTLRQSGTTARPISIGAGAVAGSLGLSNSELAKVTASVLRIGRTDNTGEISIDSPVTTQTGFSTLSLLTGGDVRDIVGGTTDIAVTNLAIQAATGIGINISSFLGIEADNLAFVNSTSGNALIEDKSGGLSLTAVDTITTESFAVVGGRLTTPGALTLAQNLTTGGDFLTSGNGITISNGVTVKLDSPLTRTLAVQSTSNVAFQGTGNILTTGTNHLVDMTGVSGTVTQSLASTVSVVCNVLAIGGSTIGSVAIPFRFNVNSLSANTSGAQVLREQNTVSVNTSTPAAIELAGGTFIASNVTASGVQVDSGATLGGGFVTGPVNVLSGGTLSPGASPGTLHTQNLSLNSGSTFAVEVNSPYTTAGSHYDQANVTGTVSLGGATLQLSGGAAAPSPGASLIIVNNDAADAVTGTFAGLAEGQIVSVGAFNAFITYKGGTGNDVALIALPSVALLNDPAKPGSKMLFVSGTSGNDNIRVSKPTMSDLEVFINNVSKGRFPSSTISRILILGLAGSDSITVDRTINIAAVIYGNEGADTVSAGNGPSILIGGDGGDVLTSGNGRDILIGGNGADNLNSSTGEDILITGTTSYDVFNNSNFGALLAIQNEWTGGSTYSTRINHLTGATPGGQNGAFLLKPTGPGQTVFNDLFADNAIGSSGTDWFLLNRVGGVLDTSDRAGSEVGTDL